MPTDQPTDQPDEPLLDDLTVSSPEQFKALAHPLRHRLLFALGQQAATISQLAQSLGTRKGNVAHHLGVLRDAGMVRVVETRQVRGGTEQYYRRTARQLSFSGEGEALNTEVMLRAVAGELATATAVPMMKLRNVRLSEEAAERLATEIERLVEEIEDAGPGHSRYGMLLAVYRPNQPDPAASG